ncbi:ABC transporter permease [Mycoplasma mycoides]|uniref:ABC transporter permease n=1 Tax=Mycoplasma mycoides TaxID=2102 RepID=UPI0027340BE9|nr:ABC transporter permease [Mycoplasma mycoides]MDP4040159.1 ABC transporter permease [Mycoplasma mycoides]MDP4041026.1 ABC transporter permease [Mycoplasma mycoides]MDP4042029.1 ABC transporter permease [Mycoplasma mycoides]MDP4043906.1 ABC transporter permease [Mycoplasma mycoides]MDP4044798.1 ABC transporter permease [Mycoplasma mycoides]
MSNLFLMFKQGLKWILKFKLQLIIIIFLTFIASSILTISFTTNKRLKTAYDQIVNNSKSQKFDSTYQIVVGNKAKPENGDPLFIPIFDFVNKDYTGFNDEGFNNFNLYFNKFYGKETLLTKVISSDEFKKIWTNQKNKNLFLKDQKDEQVAKNQEDFDFEINDLLFSTMIDLLNKNDQSISNTVISKYTKTNPSWYKHFWKDNKPFTWLEFLSNKELINKLEKEHPEELKIYYYSYYAFESFSQYLFKTIRTFIRHDHWKDQTENIAKIVYEFLFGIEFDNNSKHDFQKEYITTNTNKYTTHFNKTVLKTEFEKMNFLNTNKEDTFFYDIIKKGFKGILRPLIVYYSEDDNYIDIQKVSQYSETNELRGFLSGSNVYTQNVDKLLDIFKNNELVDLLVLNTNPFLNITNKTSGFFISNDDIKKSTNKDFMISAAFLTHHKLTALANGYDLYIRPETIFNDPITKKTFRIINISDQNHTNYLVLNGNKPINASQITVSRQFAKANKIKIGSSLNLGQAVGLVVSGYAVDTYSFFPTSDPNVPLPKSDSGGLIYASDKTIDQIIGDQTDPSNNDQTTIYNFFLIKKQSDANLNNLYLDHFSKSTKIRENINAYNNKNKANTFYKTYYFDKSWYSLNWTLYQKITFYYSLATFLTAGLIALIAALAVFVGVIKSIQANAKQIGILKANGVYSKTIASSYIWYALILVLISIPIGWMFGTVLQVPFVGIFKDYFSLKVEVIEFDWISVLISVAIFGFLIGLFSFIVALFNIHKPVLQVINHTKKWSRPRSTDWLKKYLFKKIKFNNLLMLKLTESGKKPFSLLLILTFIATLFISIGIAIPSIAIHTKNNYFKNINYNNEYQIFNNITNTPLGKDTLNLWNGHENLDNSYKTIKTKQQDISYYDDPNSYTLSVNNSSILPTLVYKINQKDNKAEILTPYKSFIKNYLETGISDLYTNLLDWSVYQLSIANSRSISIGTIEQLYAYILNDADLNKHFENDKAKLDFLNITTQPLTQFVSKILEVVFDNKVQKNTDWKDKILNLVLGYAPTFIKSYLTNDSKKTQLAFGFQSQNVISQKDQLATVFSPYSNNLKTNYQILGLDKTQNSFKIDDKLKNKVFLSNSDIQNIYQIINSPYQKQGDDLISSSTNQILYNRKTNTLNVPTILNQTLNNHFLNNQNILDNISSYNSQLMYKTKSNDFKILPKQAWLYDDTDYLNTKYVTKHTKWIDQPIQSINDQNNYSSYGYEIVENDNKKHYYLNPYNLDVNKFTQRQVIDLWSEKNENNNDFSIEKQVDNIVENSPIFGDFVINKNGEIIKSFLRPYYQLRNLKLFIPISDEISWEDFAKYALGWGNNQEPNDDWKANLEKQDEHTREYIQPALKKLKINQVPLSVKNAWDSVLTNKNITDYIEIRPYDFSIEQERRIDRRHIYFQFTPGYINIKGVLKSAPTTSLDNLILNGSALFYRRALGKRKNIAPILKLENSKVNYVNKDLKIKLTNIGVSDIYGKSYAIIDSDLANMIYGYDISRSINYDYRPFDTSKIIKKNQLFNTYNTTNWEKQNIIDPWKNTYLKSKNVYDYSPHYYYNTIFSNSSEPLTITSSISIIPEKRLGLAIIDLLNLSDYKTAISNVNFINQTKQLIDQLTKTSIYIAIIIITAISLSASLLIMLITNIYISQYKSFMIMLRSMGYTNKQTIWYVLGITKIFNILVIILTISSIFLPIMLLNKLLVINNISIPISVQWWSLLVCLIIVLFSFFIAIWISTKSIRNTQLSEILNQSE